MPNLTTMKMKAGYNLVEKRSIGKEFEEIKDKMSIIEFCRKLKRNEQIKKMISVTGLEEALALGDEIARYIRGILVNSVGMLRGHIIQFPINGELRLYKEPKIKYKDSEISLTPIFGNRLKQERPGFFHSPPFGS